MSTQLKPVNKAEVGEITPLKPRSAPENVHMEQELLGAILVNNNTFYQVSSFLKTDHFHDVHHRSIYEKISLLIQSGKTATPLTLKTFFPSDLQIAGMGAAQYLLRIAAQATTIINAVDYGRHIHDLAVRRMLISAGEDIVNTAFDAPIELSASDQIERAEQSLYSIAEQGEYSSGFHTFSDALTEAINMAAAAYQRDGQLSGLSTGLKDLDDKLGGLQPSDLVVLAARPAMGKTALATNIAFYAAQNYKGEEQTDGTIKTVNGAIVGFFSLEMSAEQLATRIVSEQAQMPSEKIRRGKLDETDYAKIVDVSQKLQHIPFYIDHTGGLSIGQLAARARRLKRQKGLDLLIIDYVQLMHASSRRASDSRVQEITEITTGLKALAKELNIPILAISQLSRQVESRDDKRPLLSDLRESGSIEQDADVVLFIYREEYYLEKKKPKESSSEFATWMAEMEDATNKAEVIISKQRHGPTGTVELQFQKEFTRFNTLARNEYLPERTY